jgi:hypothetical protein
VNVIDANREYIEAALAHSNGTHDFESVRAAILAGEMQLWPAPKSAAVTEVVEYAKKKVINVFLAGGDLDEITRGIDSVAAWAKAHGCDSMTIAGRKGWTRVLDKHGFAPAFVVMERALK